MKFEEFKNAIGNWGMEYGYEPTINVQPDYIDMVFEDDGSIYTIGSIHRSEMSIIDLDWSTYKDLFQDARSDLLKIVTKFATTKPENREYEEDNKNLDLIIHMLGVIQNNARDVMNWTMEEIQERSWNLSNVLEDMIIELEELNETYGGKE